MIKTGLQNEKLVGKILVSGSLVIDQRNGTNAFTLIDESNPESGIISGKLTKPAYNNSELIKSIDTNIVELIPIKAPDLPDTVLRSVYNPVTQSVIDLTVQVQSLNQQILGLNNKISQLEIVSESLRVELDNKNLIVATTQNQSSQTNSKIQSSITDLQNAIQKSTSEAIQRVSLFARNQSLQQEIDSLRSQLNAKNQAIAAGGVSTGQLSTIVFEKGDPTKLQGANKQMIGMDYGGGYGSQASAGKFAAPGNDAGKTFQSYFEVVAGPKDVKVEVKFTGGISSSIFDFGFPIPVTLKANETKRFDMSKPSNYLNSLPGQHGGNILSHSSPTEYDFTMSVIVSVIDGTDKTEQKDFTFHLWNHN
jgi:hypothetical protein